MFAQVALFSPPYSILTYTLPGYLPHECWQVGQRVAAPLGNGLRAGIIVALEENAPALAAGAAAKAEGMVFKPLLWPLEHGPLLSPAYQEMARQLALRHTATLGNILGHLLPAGLRTTGVTLRFFGTGKPWELKLNRLKNLGEAELAQLGAIWAAGKATVSEAKTDPLDREVCALAGDPPWPVKPGAKKQIALLEFLFAHGTVPRRRLVDAFGTAVTPILQTMAERGLVRISPAGSAPVMHPGQGRGQTTGQSAGQTPLGGEQALVGGQAPVLLKSHALTHGVGLVEEAALVEEFGLEAAELVHPGGDPSLLLPSDALLPAHFILTPHQRIVLDPLAEALATNKAETRLLFGVTGSGKTAVYLELARQALLRGRSVLLLAPEVALAYKLWGDLEHAMPGATRFLFHGYQSQAAREAAFRALARQQTPCVVVGTRSALFLPMPPIGLIVLDEEHDASFKQEEGFVYQAKEVAWFRAGQENAMLLLGSASPDVKTYHAATLGRIQVHTLTERVGGGALPEVNFVTLGRGRADAELLAQESKLALCETVERGEQAVILLNRRGYAPQMYCLGCGQVVKCPHCDIGLAYHKARERLLCHYCGYVVPFPSPCSNCKGMHFLPMGEGTEKVEESLATLLPSGTSVLRLDRDSTRRPGSMEDILARFARGEASVLVGTQMLSKGHHFPNVTLAVVADADLGLNLPDYRAAERTFQLLLQVSGRAGRGVKPGKVLVQTRDPQHYCWQYVKDADFIGFYEREIALRERRRYPPFVRLALIRLSYPMGEEKGQDAIARIGKTLREEGKALGLQVLGPAPAPMPLLQGRRRFHCLVKAADWQPLRTLFAKATEQNPGRVLRITLDLDPVSLM